jgi:7-cyano-7-deazaguanine reductase
MTKLDNSRISKVLGKVVDYPDQYDPTILVKEPRSNNRQHLDLHDEDLPFVGFDTWNAYEASTLTATGLPVTGVLKIVYPCDSKYIVESKSIKLYLNSFNMYNCGETRETAIENISNIVSKDLCKLLETSVSVTFITDTDNSPPSPVFDTSIYESLEHDNLIPDWILDTTQLSVYEETPELIKTVTVPESVQHFRSGLLKSNCRVTNQPDWGDVYIYLLGNKHVLYESMLEYIVSFRNECHFHEEICETIYKRLSDILKPRELCVTCLYARRGGIDINPTRASHAHLLPELLVDSTVMHSKTQKQ